jgi:hypothetical protein
MKWQKRLATLKPLGAWVLGCVGLMVLASCGVKGDPLPPEKPVELGRGRPNYRRATQGLNIKKSAQDPRVYDDPQDPEKKDDTED